MRYNLLGLLAFFGFSLSSGIPHSLSAERVSQGEMPPEYSQIKRVVNKIAKHNNLGSQPLIFTIVPGTYAMSLAAGLDSATMIIAGTLVRSIHSENTAER